MAKQERPMMKTGHPPRPALLKQQGRARARERPTGARLAEPGEGTGPPPKALLVPVRVFPRSSRNELTIEADGLRVWLTAPPVEGAANEALITLVAERLRLPKRSVRVARGAASRQKMLEITGLSEEEFWQRLRQNVSER